MSVTNPSVTLAEQSPYRSRHRRATGFSDTAHCVPPRAEALTTSPNLSVRSSSTRHSRTLTDRPRSSSSSSSSRHFYASSLGRPPGQYNGQTTTTPLATPTPIASSSFPLASSSNKTIPVKEIQKVGNISLKHMKTWLTRLLLLAGDGSEEGKFRSEATTLSHETTTGKG